MAWINIVSESAASGHLGQIYEAAVVRAGKVYNILKVQSQNPKVLETSIAMYRDIMYGESPLTRVQREMLGTVTSWANRCHY